MLCINHYLFIQVRIQNIFSVHKFPDTYLYVFMSIMRFNFFLIHFKLLHSFSLVFTSLSLCVSVTTTINNSFILLKIKWIMTPSVLTNCIQQHSFWKYLKILQELIMNTCMSLLIYTRITKIFTGRNKAWHQIPYPVSCNYQWWSPTKCVEYT